MDDVGNLHEAPQTQLILYPKYPEVRMSGFLNGASMAPSDYLRSRETGRVMILGITRDRRIIGHIIGSDNPVNQELEAFDAESGVFSIVFKEQAGEDSTKQLICRLKEIHEMGWVESCKLDGDGNRKPYNAPNGGGYTLEALLGIVPNGVNEPDYFGWEIKQHKARLDNPLSGGAITLMTPEPTGGIYIELGVIEFIKLFGYPDKSGKPDRMNFGGIHLCGKRQNNTGLTLELIGYDITSGKILDINGGISLLSDCGEKAAVWHFSKLLEKWNRKHAQAAYIPSNKRKVAQGTQYMYGHTIALGTGTDFSKLLSAMAKRSVYYDPGIKVENISTAPIAKKRSQFRVRPPLIPDLYSSLEIVDLRNNQ